MLFHYNDKIKIVLNFEEVPNINIYFNMEKLGKRYLLVGEGLIKDDKINYTYLYPELKSHYEFEKIIKYCNGLVVNRALI